MQEEEETGSGAGPAAGRPQLRRRSEAGRISGEKRQQAAAHRLIDRVIRSVRHLKQRLPEDALHYFVSFSVGPKEGHKQIYMEASDYLKVMLVYGLFSRQFKALVSILIKRFLVQTA